MDMDYQGREQWRRVTDVRPTSEAYARALKNCFAYVEQVGFARDERGLLLFVEYRVWDAGSSYALRYSAAYDDAPCPCRRGLAHHACWHRGAALIKARDLRRLFAQQARGRNVGA